MLQEFIASVLISDYFKYLDSIFTLVHAMTR